MYVVTHTVEFNRRVLFHKLPRKCHLSAKIRNLILTDYEMTGYNCLFNIAMMLRLALID